MASLSTQMRECQLCTHGNGICNGEVVSISTSAAREVFVTVRPGDIVWFASRTSLQILRLLAATAGFLRRSNERRHPGTRVFPRHRSRF